MSENLRLFRTGCGLPVRAFLFDLDGLMVDSEPLSQQAWDLVIARRGKAIPASLYNQLLGMRLAEVEIRLVHELKLEDLPETLGEERDAIFLDMVRGDTARPSALLPMPGLRPLLEELRARQVPMALATSGRQPYPRLALQVLGLADYFTAIASGDMVAQGKPAPDIFLKAAELLHVPPPNCLVLEDAPNGIEAARRAGMWSIAIPNAHTRHLDLSHATAILPSLEVVRQKLPQILA
ncbi:MAG: HAD family phosphatase [Chloroflexi bacterium]|nr:HAD family phosphatase [Chloroflexota bacterium]